jgi:hypothetical protein
MMRISTSPAAYAAIAATLPGSVNVEPNRAPYGYSVWLEPALYWPRRLFPGFF